MPNIQRYIKCSKCGTYHPYEGPHDDGTNISPEELVYYNKLLVKYGSGGEGDLAVETHATDPFMWPADKPRSMIFVAA